MEKIKRRKWGLPKSVYLFESQVKKIEILERATGRTFSDIIRQIIDQYQNS